MAELEKPNVLIVDDRPENLFALENILEDLDVNIVKAASGKEALYQVLQQDFAIIILDVQMPEMDGFETAELMRGREKSRHVPIIFATAISKEQKNIFRGYEAGAVDYLFKPIEPEILKNKVKVFLDLYKQTKLIELQAKTLEENEEKFRCISASAMDAIILVNSEGTISYWNESAERIFGYKAQDIIGEKITSLIPSQYQEAHQDGFELLIKSQQQDEMNGQVIELSAIKSDGTEFPVEISLAEIRIKGKSGAVAIVRDITDRKLAEQQLESLAHFDSLTGLPNRNMFTENLNHVIAMAKRYKHKFALLFVDLDRFKSVNDTFGHDVGDLLLKEVSKRMKENLRESDMVARMGGDEFTIILSKIKEDNDAAIVSKKIIETLNQPFHLADHECSIGASIGICIFPSDSIEAETLLTFADAAMYTIKKNCKNSYQFYTSEINDIIHERAVLENNLRKAIEQNEFEVYYQPQVDIQTREIIGMEALVRWLHPTLGLISPVKFIPLAEEMGLILEIDEWVMRTAFMQNKRWQEAGFKPLRVAVNVSAQRFKQKDQTEVFSRLLKETHLSPHNFELELTESILMQNTEITIQAMHELQKIGVYLSLDDFGTGYSSMSYLKNLPVYKLKIDRSFIRDIIEDPNDIAIVTAIITLGHSLNLKVLAEGVETNEQLELLRSLGCDEIQGYLFSRPVPASEFEKLLSKENKDEKVLVQA